MPTPAGLRDDFRRMIKPSGEGQPRIRPSTAKEKTLDLFNKWELPLAGPLGDFLKEEAIGEMMGGGVSLAAGIIPKQFLRKLAQETAERAAKIYRNTPKIAQVATDMAEKHPYMAGHLSDFEYVQPGSRFSGSYQKGNKNAAKFIINKTPTLAMPSKFYQHILDKGGEEELARVAQKQLGKLHINPDLENSNIAEIYKTVRHEYSHEADDLARFGKYLRGKTEEGGDPRYWTSTPEVRARAVERNYGRDMGAPEGKSVRRPYARSIMDELQSGASIAESKVAHGRLDPYTGRRVTKEDLNETTMSTLNHYFGQRPAATKITGEQIRPAQGPRLKPTGYHANDLWLPDYLRDHLLDPDKFKW
jgi:hypothetical protein